MARFALNGSLSDAAFPPLSLVFNQAGVTQLNGPNTFTGGATISSGTVQLGNTGALNAASPNAVTFGSGSFTTADMQLNGNSVTVSALNSYDETVISTVENSGTSPATLTVNGPAGSTYDGVLQDGTGASSAIARSLDGQPLPDRSPTIPIPAGPT